MDNESNQPESISHKPDNSLNIKTQRWVQGSQDGVP